MAQEMGIPLAEVGESLKALPRGHVPTKEDWAAISEGWRSKLDRRITLLQRLRGELDNCIGCGCLSLERCPIYNAGDHLRSTGSGPRVMLRDGNDVLPPV
jgi:MerR family redox-sensitive transcriptional activator SoxR